MAEISSITTRIDSVRNSFSSLETGLFAEVRAKSDELKIEIQRATEDFNNTRIAMIEKTESDISRVHEKLRNVEENINESRARLIASFEDEQNKIRNSMDELTIHAISKKDEIVKAARREAEDIRQKIENFDEKYTVMQRTLNQTAENSSALLNSEFSRMEERLGTIKNEIMSYEESNRIFSRADEMARQVEFAVRHFGELIEESRDKARILEEFIGGIEEFRDAKKQLDKELKLYQSKRDGIAHIESEIQGFLALADSLQSKSDTLETNAGKIDQVDARIRAMGDAYNNLEKRITELREYDDFIAQNLDHINKIDVIVNAFEGRINSFEKNIGVTEKKLSKMREYLTKVEESTITLKAREQEILNVMDKFQELDSLSEHLEERIKQITAMLSRVESMKNEVERTDSHFQTITTEADKKIKQLTDIVHSVPQESSNPGITKQIKGNPSISKGINDAMVKMVRDLSHKGWTPADIAKNMMLEENTVRLIINTSA
jgi:chromosome segregation ATPase